ncbi:two-component sensor histidine kinase [Saccharibacillus sp. O23]|uniref:sensor histidine kinase n=1 Tax=Saccharibacillus sp. O23 TaxID=2009338 RepID=UPI000B4E2671|nr:HAMP domain-containing sensor histidine kinase [Saccharibacillus sp. O23]OWR30753.1 two-component sensor histidine kinase [Saccharibacillus sp. O23]
MLKSIRGRLLLQIGLLLLTIILLLEAVFAAAVSTYYFDSARQIVQSRAVTAATLSNQFMEGYTLNERARYILENLVPGESSRVEVLDLQGRTVVDSYGFSSSRRTRTPDVRVAQQGGVGSYSGYSKAFKQRIMAVSSPLVSYGEVIGTLRFSVSTEPLYREVAKLIGWAIGIGAAMLLLGFALSLIIARRIVGPIKELTAISRKMATGDFTAKAVRKHDDEVGMLTDSLNHMNEELAKSEKMKNDFISTVSHELRTPLTSIKGWGETLVIGGLDDEETTMLGLNVITGETNRLIGLVEDLLDFSKYQAGEIRMRSVPVDLNNLLSQLDLQYSMASNKRGVVLLTKLSDEPLPMHADLNRLKQVFVNLIDNAIKFSDPNGEIRMVASRKDLEVHVAVQDDGEGIPAEDLERIGQRFYKGSSKMSGSGLGLAISKEIVRLHGGRLKIESEYGVGTTVTVTLPLAVDDSAEKAEAAEQEPPI